MKYSFTDWLASKNSVAFCLLIGVLFLFLSYTNVLHYANPQNANSELVYPEWLLFSLSHIDSFFFALATSIIIFQSDSHRQKMMYVSFEAIMIALNFNRGLIPYSQIYLSLYIAIYSAFTLYLIGNLANAHRLKDAINNNTHTTYLDKYPQIAKLLKEGKSLNEIKNTTLISKSTIQKVKVALRQENQL